MYYPEFDALCHEVAGKLSELRRLTMETVILTDEQEALLAELTRLLRLVDACASQQRHSLLGDTATPDSDFLTELRDELGLLATPATPLHSPTPSSPKGKEGEPEGVSPLPLGEGLGRGGEEAAKRGTSEDGGEAVPVGFKELPVPPGLLTQLYWDIRPVYPNDTRLLYAHDADWNHCLIVTHEQGQTALSFPTEQDRAAYLGEVYREALDRPKPDTDEHEQGGEPDAPVPAPVLPHDPVLVGGNARRWEDAVEESEREG